ncbi:GAG-pre-integrase domain-containing protein, partial [Heyndrickxia coagulans]|uniref:GAG-pre-integrase domain-containing protein n=1 Tax=Heyndrickxia coagulans TaxID=1398 RepID=UPI00214DBE3F
PKVASVSTQGDPLDSKKESEVMLSHFRLGHPNFAYLQKLFPLLFIHKKPSLFQCEVCQLSHTHLLFSRPLSTIPTLFSNSYRYMGTLKGEKH